MKRYTSPTARSRVNAGVIERYYGRASSAPALVFPLLLSLSRHHLSKLQKGNSKDGRAASAIERRMTEILATLKADSKTPGEPPKFPGILSLERQGRFALGFYQQKAHDIEQWRKYKVSHGKEGDDIAEEEDAPKADAEPSD